MQIATSWSRAIFIKIIYRKNSKTEFVWPVRIKQFEKSTGNRCPNRRSDPAERRKIYQRLIATLDRDRNIIYLYHDKLFTGSRSDVTGVEVRPDGLPRLAFADVGGKGGV